MYFEDFTILYPESNNMPKAESSLFHMRDTLSKSKLLMADFFYQYRNNPRAARILYNEAITLYHARNWKKSTRANWHEPLGTTSFLVAIRMPRKMATSRMNYPRTWTNPSSRQRAAMSSPPRQAPTKHPRSSLRLRAN